MKNFKKIIFSALFISPVAHAQYCTLPGRTPYSANQPGIEIFKLNTINRTSGHVEDMSKVLVVTNDSTALLRGHTYTVTIKHNRDSIVFPDTRNNIRVWIDYNNNYKFTDTGETVVSADFVAPGYYTATFTVPVSAPLATVRLRATAKMSSDAGHIIPSPCDSPTVDPIGYHGEMEDYKVRILPTTGIDDIANVLTDIVIYPNPSTDKVSLSFNKTLSGTVAIDLLDIAGRQFGNMVKNGIQSSESVSLYLNEPNIVPGGYIVRVTTGEEVIYRRIVINK